VYPGVSAVTALSRRIGSSELPSHVRGVDLDLIVRGEAGARNIEAHHKACLESLVNNNRESGRNMVKFWKMA
jgi:hypothetical protein